MNKFVRILFIRITRLKIVKKLRISKNHGKAQIYDEKLRRSNLDPPSRVFYLQWKVFNFEKLVFEMYTQINQNTVDRT